MQGQHVHHAARDQGQSLYLQGLQVLASGCQQALPQPSQRREPGISLRVGELLPAIRAASQGDTYLSPAISGTIIADSLALQADAETLGPSAQLTPREHEVLQLVSEGRTNAAIAEAMKISVKTVEKHRANVMSKLNVHDLAGLMRAAIEHDLIFLEK